MNIISFLDLHSGAVIAIFTGVYVVGTLLMWWEMRKTRLRQEEPNVQVSLEPQARWGKFFDLVIENIGNVPVYNMELDIEPKGLRTRGEGKLEDLDLFKRTIPVFGVGQSMSTLAIYYVDFIQSDQPKKISFIVTYKTADGKLREQRYDFDLEVYRGMSASTERSLNDVVDEMKKLTRGVVGIEQSLRRR